MPRATFAFADLFSGIGGFHAALAHGGGRCVFASEIDSEARATYAANWLQDLDADERRIVLNEDITLAAPEDGDVTVPAHDVLTAGFPCQPFSKSGAQRGMEETRGTLFYNIARVLKERTPSVILLENVRNIHGPRHIEEWRTIIRTLRQLGYRVPTDPARFSPHLLPPGLGGTPQMRERVYIAGTFVGRRRAEAETDAEPVSSMKAVGGWDPARWEIEWALDEMDYADSQRYALSNVQATAVRAWDTFVKAMWDSRRKRLPGFPLWTHYWWPLTNQEFLEELDNAPAWKQVLMLKNRKFFKANERIITSWHRAYASDFDNLPLSYRKFEWQLASNLRPDLRDVTIQFRPSGLRCKAPTYLPALVAITQTSAVGYPKRRLTPTETARLQGFPVHFTFANKRESDSYKQTGNAVAVGAVWHILTSHLIEDERSGRHDVPDHIRRSVLGAPPNPSEGILRPAAYEALPQENPLPLIDD